MYVGEFGKVYKGTWERKSDNGDAISQIVAVKTIKSMYTGSNNFPGLTI